VIDRPSQIDDLILTARILPALQLLREELGCTIHEAIDAFQERYDELRTERPDEFTVSREEYGRGVYT
jgi:hypothetical protein